MSAMSCQPRAERLRSKVDDQDGRPDAAAVGARLRQSPLAHLIEGGTGTHGAPGFNHREHRPSIEGIMRANRPAATASVPGGAGDRGARRQSAEAVHRADVRGRGTAAGQMAEEVVDEVLR